MSHNHKMSCGWRVAMRRKLREIHGDNCHWCGEPMIFRKTRRKTDEPNMATIEHLIKLEDGGLNELENLRLAHKRCNR